MKKVLLIIVAWTVSLWVVAGNVTPEEALRQATQFLQEKAARQGGQHRAAEVPQLQAAGVVSNLYVFNVANDKGFVIVSNDDRAFPILGYSNSGTLDLQNMPDNMRAWLQGYADEIAWAQQHGTGTVNDETSEERSFKAPILPMLTSRWSQANPYNILCPEYQSQGKYYKSVTGCVATAMAQVMYYHKWPEKTTTEIPSYTSTTYSIFQDAIPAESTIDWDNMLDVYSSGYSDAEATAIAQLMHYCGVSVKMNYGPSSGAYSYRVATALKDYFGYNTETTKCLSRSSYSYDDWVNMMYNELEQGRPVIYGASSTGGGHEFVVDGYDNADFFHINWGWAGLSDNYFKLSALDPDQQGIGGSNSTDGYCYGQDATIGIQKPTEDGTSLDITPRGISLEITGVSLPECPVRREKAEVTINVRNRKTDVDYDGDIAFNIYYKSGDSYSNVGNAGNTFLIPANTTKECKVSFVPDYSGQYRIKIYHQSETPGYIRYIDDVYYYIDVLSNVDLNNDVELGCVHNIENCEGNKFYGNTLKANVTYTNNTEEAYRGKISVYLYHNGVRISTSTKSYLVPANSSINIPFEKAGLAYGESYQLVSSYKIGSTQQETYSNNLACTPAIISRDAEGNEVVTIPGNTYEVSDDASSVNLVGTTLTEVTHGSNPNPNCLYIIDEGADVPTGISSNIIRYDESTDSYSAATLKLTDGKNFSSPVAFTAENIEFTYTFTVGANGTGGWNTIMLPFEVSSVTADGVPIHWFESGSDTGKQFWLKEFVSDGASSVGFDYVPGTTMQANTPYIVAFPGSSFVGHDLSGKVIKFIGQNVTIGASNYKPSVVGNNYRFMGSTSADETHDIYTINGAGDRFVLSDGCGAFRAYFKADLFDRTVGELTIGSEGGTTAIFDVNMLAPAGDGCYYNLNGQRVKTPRQGLYVKDGKKIFVK